MKCARTFVRTPLVYSHPIASLSTAPDPEAGWSSPEIHALLLKNLGSDIFYKWRNGELAQQELTQMVLDCLVGHSVVAADKAEAAVLSLNNSWKYFGEMADEDKL